MKLKKKTTVNGALTNKSIKSDTITGVTTSWGALTTEITPDQRKVVFAYCTSRPSNDVYVIPFVFQNKIAFSISTTKNSTYDTYNNSQITIKYYYFT